MLIALDSLSQSHGIQGQTHRQHALESKNDSFYRWYNHVNIFFAFCLMDNNILVTNHGMDIYGIPFPLSRIVYLSTCFVLRAWNLLFCETYESHKARKVLSPSSRDLNLFVNLHILWGIGTHCRISCSMLCIPMHMLVWSISNRKPAKVWIM